MLFRSAIGVTAVGEASVRGPLRRDGARPGDAIVVTGEFGGSILGKHFDFEPRVHEARTLHEGYELHAGMDVSDGLSLDLARLCAASGCGAVLDLDNVPIAAAARELAARRADGSTAFDHALGDGEDFELLLAMPPDEAHRLINQQPLAVPVTVVGQFIEQVGLWQSQAGQLVPLTPKGFLHG